MRKKHDERADPADDVFRRLTEGLDADLSFARMMAIAKYGITGVELLTEALERLPASQGEFKRKVVERMQVAFSFVMDSVEP